MLVNCVAYEEGRKLADIDKREISDYLKRPGCFVWVALLDATEAELEEMREEFGESYSEFIPSDSSLMEIFERRFRSSPDDFAPIR